MEGGRGPAWRLAPSRKPSPTPHPAPGPDPHTHTSPPRTPAPAGKSWAKGQERATAQLAPEAAYRVSRGLEGTAACPGVCTSFPALADKLDEWWSWGRGWSRAGGEAFLSVHQR